jgi:predicted amidohydrolase
MIQIKREMKIAVAQFEPRDGDKAYNLEVIAKLTRQAEEEGADVISFHELSVTAYTFLQHLNRSDLFELAEEVPNGNSCRRISALSEQHGMAVLAGILEREGDRVYNTYVCAHRGRIIQSFRKLHPFIHPELSSGNEYVLFDLMGWKCSMLICYDNNVIENVRAATLLGAEIIFAPHVTGCTPSSMPGRGFVMHELWEEREKNPEALRQEFDGMKGREWLLRWLPARAYDNGVFFVFSNPIGYDGDHLKNGNSMVLDPYGNIVTEISSFRDDIAIATLDREILKLAGGYRYRMARRPELYRDIIGKKHMSSTVPVWLKRGN